MSKLAIAMITLGLTLSIASPVTAHCITVIDKYAPTVAKVSELLKSANLPMPHTDVFTRKDRLATAGEVVAFAENTAVVAPRILIIHFSTFETATFERSDNMRRFVTTLEDLTDTPRTYYVVYSNAFRIGDNGQPVVSKNELLAEDGMFEGVTGDRIETVVTPNNGRFQRIPGAAADQSGADELLKDVDALLRQGVCE